MDCVGLVEDCVGLVVKEIELVENGVGDGIVVDW